MIRKSIPLTMGLLCVTMLVCAGVSAQGICSTCEYYDEWSSICHSRQPEGVSECQTDFIYHEGEGWVIDCDMSGAGYCPIHWAEALRISPSGTLADWDDRAIQVSNGMRIQSCTGFIAEYGGSALKETDASLRL